LCSAMIMPSTLLHCRPDHDPTGCQTITCLAAGVD
jgi:hypothetical protein